MSKQPKPERHKKNAAKHAQQSAQQKGISEMSATPSDKPPSNPKRTRKDAEYSPNPSEMLRRFVIWLRGFHLHREKSKVTDWFVVTLTLGVAIAAFYSALIFQRQLEEARKSTRLSVRPWIGLDEGVDSITTSPLKIDAEGNASIVYTIRTKNYGSVPATNVWASASLVVADDLHTVWERQDTECNDAMIGKPEMGWLLFQGRNRILASMPSFTKVNQKVLLQFEIHRP